MKLFIILLFISLTHLSWAKKTVLVSYYEPFDGGKTNNAETIAKLLHQKYQSGDIKIILCKLETVFDKAFLTLENCLQNLKKEPIMVLSLGEYGCKLKAEILAQNLDDSNGPDNEGNERNGVILPEKNFIQALRYPLPEMYCALDEKERTHIEISSYAGGFVCNNTAFQFAHKYPQLQFGFIHVPSHDCWFLKRKNKMTLNLLSKMINAGVNFLGREYFVTPEIPHPSNEFRLPVLKKEIAQFIELFEKKNSCYEEFFLNSSAADE